jgi:hypothetical protein
MKRSRLTATLAASIAAVALVAACTSEEILLAKVPASSEGGTRRESARCVDTTDCARNAFCEKRSCDSVGGSCEPRPIVCEDEASPVCGCDGVTYWNDCLRRVAGVSAMAEGECTKTALTCGPKGSDPSRPPPPRDPGDPAEPLFGCPEGASCARLLPFGGTDPTPTADECPRDELQGTCWSLPAVCPSANPGSDRWLPCGVANAPCATTCEAIRSGEPYKRAKACL